MYRPSSKAFMPKPLPAALRRVTCLLALMPALVLAKPLPFDIGASRWAVRSIAWPNRVACR